MRLAGLASVAALACFAVPASASDGRLSAVPTTPTAFVAPDKGQIVNLPHGAKAYLPAGIGAKGPAPLLLLLHGTGGNGGGMLDAFRKAADVGGFILLAPSARGENWDSVDLFFDDYESGKPSARTGWPGPEFGPDATRIDAALAALFKLAPVDPSRVGILGFSHGASYALILGTANPQLFGSIIAFSPGILILKPDVPGGQAVYVAHGKGDTTLPYWRTEKNFIPRLNQLGYRVTFRPFDGGHEIDPKAYEEGLNLFYRTRRKVK